MSHVCFAPHQLTSQSDLEVVIVLSLAELEKVDLLDIVASLLEDGAVVARARHLVSRLEVSGVKVVRVCKQECGCREVECTSVVWVDVVGS